MIQCAYCIMVATVACVHIQCLCTAWCSTLITRLMKDTTIATFIICAVKNDVLVRHFRVSYWLPINFFCPCLVHESSCPQYVPAALYQLPALPCLFTVHNQDPLLRLSRSSSLDAFLLSSTYKNKIEPASISTYTNKIEPGCLNF